MKKKEEEVKGKKKKTETIKKEVKKEDKKVVKKEVKKEPKKEEKVEETKKVVKEEKKNDKINITVDKTNLLKGIGVALLVIAVLGIAFMVSKNSNGNGTTFEFVDITIDEYLEKMKSEEKSIIYVARPGCSWCQKESPIIKRVGAENKLTIYYLNTDSFWDSENNTYTESGKKFIESNEKYKDGWGTPNTIIVGNGTIIDGEFSYVERDKLIDLFKKNGFING